VEVPGTSSGSCCSWSARIVDLVHRLQRRVGSGRIQFGRKRAMAVHSFSCGHGDGILGNGARSRVGHTLRAKA
jgi:hypothetical protein